MLLSLLSKSEAEQNIGFHSYFCAGAVCMDSLVLFGFHNSLNINPKQSGTSNFTWILSWFVGFFPTTPGFAGLASTTRLK